LGGSFVNSVQKNVVEKLITGRVKMSKLVACLERAKKAEGGGGRVRDFKIYEGDKGGQKGTGIAN